MATLFLFILHLSKISTPAEWTWLEVLSWDKLVHVILFFAWMSIVLISPVSKRFGNIQWGFLGIALGLLLELAQALLTTYRSGEWWDLLADSIGITFALIYFKDKV